MSNNGHKLIMKMTVMFFQEMLFLVWCPLRLASSLPTVLWQHFTKESLIAVLQAFESCSSILASLILFHSLILTPSK